MAASARPLGVARVIAKLEPGGAQLGAFRLSQALRRVGIESHLIAGDATAEGIALARAHGLEVDSFAEGTAHGRGGPDLQWTPSRLFADWLAPRLTGADLVHAHMFGAWWAAAQSLPAATPLVASEHNALSWPDEPYLAEARQALQRVDLFFAHGPASYAQVAALGCPPERLMRGRGAIAGTGVQPHRDLPRPRLVFAGRLTPDKGPDVLVEALGLLPAPPPVFMLGEGRMRPQLERRVRELGLDAVVTFTGWQCEPSRWVAGATALVSPSREEAWSQSVVQAMALGTPVVGAAVEGLPHVLADGRGILVPPEDPPALAEALAGVLDGRLRTDVGAARAYAADFTPARVGRDYAAAYRRVLAARAAPEVAAVSAPAGPAPGGPPSSA
jgi:glycosyltransferase involved in cell wall biosynthesis